MDPPGQPPGGGSGGRVLAAVTEPPAVVAGLDDVAVVGETVEQRGGHLGVTEDARPCAEGEVGGDDHRGAFIEAADGVWNSNWPPTWAKGR